MTTILESPRANFDALNSYKARHHHHKESKFENDLTTLRKQLFKRLNQKTKMLKHMKNISKKRGKDEIQLTKWKINMFSPIYPYSSKSQRWMLFRVCFDLWGPMEDIYGKGFSFRIKENNSDPSSRIKYHLFLTWNPTRQKPDVMNQISKFECPSNLTYDPREEYYQRIKIRQLRDETQKAKEALAQQQQQQQQQQQIHERQYGQVPGDNVFSSEPSELGAPTHQSLSSTSSSGYLDRTSPTQY